MEQAVTSTERVLLRDQIDLLQTQLRDTRDDRDHWRVKADEITELLKAEQDNVKLITHQTGSNNGLQAGQVIAVVCMVVLVAVVVYWLK